MKKTILAYIPVLHAGYKKFLEKNQGEAETLYILGEEIIAEFDHLKRKDIRALSPKLIQESLKNWGLKLKIKIANKKDLAELNNPKTQIIISNEIEMDEVVKKYLGEAQIERDSIFLRYDKKKSLEKREVEPKETITLSKFLKKIMDEAEAESQKSSDWWRQVGAVIFNEKEVLLSGHNTHVPHEQMPYINGDPRGNFHKGEQIDLSTALHAEANLITKAAKKGLALNNAEMYVTTFPCPPCAKLIAYSGIKKIYFKEGYAMLDGESILKSCGVEILKICS
jgi:dCMP deaminase